MATTVAGGTPTCVSWLLLASFAVLLCVGGIGMWVSVTNFGYEEALPPTPPPTDTNSPTTTTPAPLWGRPHYHSNRMKTPQAYIDYLDQSEAFARITYDVRFYFAPLCLVCVVVASLILVAGFFSMRLFSSTFSLYSCLGLWILALGMTIVYQYSIAWDAIPFDQHTVGWTLIFHIFLLLFLPVQMVLCMWELQRQKAEGWPTINLLSFFTLEALLLASRLFLALYTIMTLGESEIYRGFEGKHVSYYDDYYYGVPRIRYPLEFSLLLLTSTFYNAVAILETTLSMLLGKLHHFMTSLTCLLSGLCCVTIAFLSSPTFIKEFIGPSTMYPSTMHSAIGLSVVTYLHWLACMFIPSLRTPLNAAVTRAQEMKEMEAFPKEIKRDVHIKTASVIFSIISITMTLVSLEYSRIYQKWGHILVLCASVVTVFRTLPPLVMKNLQKEKGIPMHQRLNGVAFEAPALLMGGIVMCITGRDHDIGRIVGVINIFIATFQGFVTLDVLKEKLSQDLHCADTKQLKSVEEVKVAEEVKQLKSAEKVTSKDNQKELFDNIA